MRIFVGMQDSGDYYRSIDIGDRTDNPPTFVCSDTFDGCVALMPWLMSYIYEFEINTSGYIRRWQHEWDYTVTPHVDLGYQEF